MKRTHMWQDRPLPPEAYQFRRAFAIDTMAYSQWLQFIFIPRVREIIAGKGQFPSVSHVGAQAVREFDGMEEAGELVSLLCQFDALFNRNTLFGGAIGAAVTTRLPFKLQMKVFGITLAMGAWVLFAFLIAHALGGWLNMRLPRLMMWDATSQITREGVEVGFQFQARIGRGQSGPITIDRLEIQLSIDLPPDPTRNITQENMNRLMRNMRFPILDRRVLVAGEPKDGEILIADVTRETVRDWFQDILAKTTEKSKKSKAAALARADDVFDAIEKARMAKTRDELLALGSGTYIGGLRFESTKAPLEYGDYLKDTSLLTAGFVLGLIGLIPFYRPLMKVRHESMAWHRGEF
ncbi:MAG: YqcC family protein [Planctomycetes bacterium]|nr:YqcC family protein [Planctomycetota bacterium]